MECGICCQRSSGRHPRGFHCATCARTTLYPLRIEHVKALLDKESFGAKVEQVLSGKIDTAQQSVSLSNTLIDTHECAKRVDLDRMRSEAAEINNRVDSITEHAAALQKEMEKYKAEIASKKAALAQRRSDAGSARHGLETRDTREIDAVQQSIVRTRYRWGKLHNETMSARFTLCREAAVLAGLKMKRRKGRDGRAKDEYMIGGVKISDLRDMNGADPVQLTASLNNLANLLVRCSLYLGLRLPAEITLQHREYPLPTVFSPDVSYGPFRVPFPSPTPEHSKTNSPSASTENAREMPRPKPLFVSKKLPVFYKEDQKAWKVFLEAVSLLAWDIAWLCWTQGVSTGNSVEGICNMGRNMWQLLMADPAEKRSTPPPQAPGSSRESTPSRAGASAVRSNLPNSTTAGSTTGSSSSTTPSFGHYSHAECFGFLGTAEGTEYMRLWRQRNHVQLSDRLRRHLENEMKGAEWEMVDEKEWADGGGMEEEEPVVVGARRFAGAIRRSSAGGAVAAAAAAQQAQAQSQSQGQALATPNSPMLGGEGSIRWEDDQVAGTAENRRGSSGWTRLRSRNGEGSQVEPPRP